jgi:hypothetical protein
MISEHPMFVIMPELLRLSTVVYDADGDVGSNFSSPTNVFAVYFSESKGSFVSKARDQTNLQYFAVKRYFPCSVYFMSSSRDEKWSASEAKGNSTIGNSQDVCLLHVSDNVTSVAGVFDTESGFDYLYDHSSGSTSTLRFYTGSGFFSESSDHFPVFRWNSDDQKLSNSFSVQLSSPLSSLSSRQCSGSGTSASPIILETAVMDLVGTESRTPGWETGDEGAQKLSQSAIAGIVFGCLALTTITVIGAMLLRRFRYWYGTVRSWGSVDQPLDLEDSSGFGATHGRQAVIQLMHHAECS